MLSRCFVCFAVLVLANRVASANSCHLLFSKAELQKSLGADFFAQMDLQVSNLSKALRGPTPDNNWTINTRIAISELVYHDYKMGREHAKFLKDNLNYQIIEINDRKRLVPPRDIWSVYSKIIDLLKNSVKSGELNAGDVMWPAIVLRSKVKSDSSNYKYLFLTPGVDKFPDSSKWELLPSEEGQLTLQAWSAALSQGKMPLMPYFIDHDIAHFTEFLIRPRLMKFYKSYYSMLVKDNYLSESVNNKLTNGKSRLDHFKESPVYSRSRYLLEASSLPNIVFKDEILNSLHIVFKTSSNPDLQTVTESLKRIPTSELESMAEVFVHNSPRWIIDHGGGSRDPYSRIKFTSEYMWNKVFMIYSQKQKNSQRLNSADKILQEFVSIGSLSSLSMILQNILATESSNRNINVKSSLPLRIDSFTSKMLFPNLYGSWDKLSSTVMNNLIDERRNMIIDILARLQLGLYYGVQLRLTPEKMLEDSLVVNMDPESSTSVFFRSWAYRSSSVWTLFANP